MTASQANDDELREQIVLTLANALYVGKSLEQISKITNKQLAPFEAAADQILELFIKEEAKWQQEVMEAIPSYHVGWKQIPSSRKIGVSDGYNQAIDQTTANLQRLFERE